MGGLVPQALVQPSALGDVLHEGELVLRFAAGVAQQGDGHVGPQDAAVAAVVRLLDAVVVAVAADELAVEAPEVGRVVGVDELSGVAAPHVAAGRAAEHAQQRVVDVDDAAFRVGDADADGGALEDRAEAGLAAVQGAFGLGLRGAGGPGDGLLLGAGALAQGAGEAGGDGVLQSGAAGAALLGGHGVVGRQVEHQVGVDDAEDLGQGRGVGAVGPDEGGADLVGGPGVEGPGVERVTERARERHEGALELGAGDAGRHGRMDRPAPDRGEPPQPVVPEGGADGFHG